MNKLLWKSYVLVYDHRDPSYESITGLNVRFIWVSLNFSFVCYFLHCNLTHLDDLFRFFWLFNAGQSSQLRNDVIKVCRFLSKRCQSKHLWHNCWLFIILLFFFVLCFINPKELNVFVYFYVSIFDTSCSLSFDSLIYLYLFIPSLKLMIDDELLSRFKSLFLFKRNLHFQWSQFFKNTSSSRLKIAFSYTFIHKLFVHKLVKD